MASTILYKFQSGTTFEALPLPGSAARLFDVKKAIVKAKKLDNSGSMEFDLAVRNADTNEEFANESMLLPRGTRLIVQRLPAARGHGFLARMARNEHAGAFGGPQGNLSGQIPTPGSAPSGFYTIDSRARDDEEFVQSGGGDDEQELAALQAATNMQSSGPAMTGGYSGGPSRSGGPPRGASGSTMGGPPKVSNFRPNADPELRDQEKQMMPKKRATGIPRTFLNLNAPPQTEGNAEGEESNVPLLQPNALGFKELVSRGGGQSETIAGTRRDLDYCLKLTATTVPEHLQCGICGGIVKNAMILPWDPEGRTACETCIRDALTQNGFRCPLTGMDGVSPDDLIPNIGLRKAAELFVKGVMEKVDEIEKQQVEEAETTEDTTKSAEANVLDGDGVEKGVIVSKKTLGTKKKDSDDPFGGGDDDFGGDVFAVDIEQPKEESDTQVEKPKEEATKAAVNLKIETSAEKDAVNETEKPKEDNVSAVNAENIAAHSVGKDRTNESRPTENVRQNDSVKETETPPKPRRRERRRRGPPVGYSMGPAGAGARVDHGSNYSPRGGGHLQGGGFRGRGGGPGRGRYPGNNTGEPYESERKAGDHDDVDEKPTRSNKRSYDDHSADGYDNHDNHRHKRHNQSSSRYDYHDDANEDRGGRNYRGGRGAREYGRGGGHRGRGRGGYPGRGGRGYSRNRY